MNWFPTPPTDNLYKFLAIIGAWGMLFVVGFFVTLNYQNYEYAEFNKKTSLIYADESWIRKAELRVKSLKEGRDGDNAIPEISNRFAPMDELVFLTSAIRLFTERLETMKELTKRPPNNLFPYLESIHVEWWLPAIFGLLLIAFQIGFSQWRVLQGISDELLRLDLTLKRRQVNERNRRKLTRNG